MTTDLETRNDFMKIENEKLNGRTNGRMVSLEQENHSTRQERERLHAEVTRLAEANTSLTVSINDIENKEKQLRKERNEMKMLLTELVSKTEDQARDCCVVMTTGETTGRRTYSCSTASPEAL